jgi:hypothetical protein
LELLFLNTAYDEPGILKLAYAYEPATKKRKMTEVITAVPG